MFYAKIKKEVYIKKSFGFFPPVIELENLFLKMKNTLSRD
jgi:hypothetical protein